MSKYTDLLDRIIELVDDYRGCAKSSVFSKEVQEYMSQVADTLETLVEDEADE